MNGIDISNWQGGLDPDSVFPNVDFVLCKATEGTGFVDSYCAGWVQWCITHGKPWGFYHFAGDAGATEEADFFIENCSNYFGGGIPVLDWETNQSVEWVNEFVARIIDRTGITPWIYANPWRFNQGGVDSRCGRWVAAYPDVVNPPVSYDPGEPPYTDGLICCWQFASDGQVPGYVGNLDVDVFYGDENAWRAYAGASSLEQPFEPEKPTNQSVLENEKFRVTIEEK